jgi:hypothetical protein
MSNSQWHRFYESDVNAPPAMVFDVLSDMPNYSKWLPPSEQFGNTTHVEPYPVQLGSRYCDGKPAEPGRPWWGTVTGYGVPGSLDFHHSLRVRQLRAVVDVHIHYSLEKSASGTRITRWLVLDLNMWLFLRPLRGIITSKFNRENLRTMAALEKYLSHN